MITDGERCGAVYFNQATTNLQGADYRHGSLLATFGGEALDDERSHPTWSFSASYAPCPREFKNILHCKIGECADSAYDYDPLRENRNNVKCFEIQFDRNL